MTEIEKRDAGFDNTAKEEKSVTKPVVVNKKSNLKFYLGAVVLVVIVLLVVFYQLEKEGRSSTTFFEGMLAAQEANSVVATVNGTEIVNRELGVSIEQFTQMASSQGVDITNESVQSEIRSQAIEVLVNTELLKQEAASRGINISEEDASTRLDSIIEEIGGEEVLEERMTTLGIDRAQLQQDIKEELLIQSLLDEVFVEAQIEVSDEEIAAVYEGAGGGTEGFPALEEVEDEVRAQITASKEQQAIDTLLSNLRSGADIEIIE